MSRLDDIKRMRDDRGKWAPGNVVDWLIGEVERLTAEGSLWADMNAAVADEHDRAEAAEASVAALTAENAALRAVVDAFIDATTENGNGFRSSLQNVRASAVKVRTAAVGLSIKDTPQ